GMEAAILGGIGSLMGSLWGGVILGIIEAVGSLFLPTAFRDAYGLAVLVAILLFRPAGLFGTECCRRSPAWLPRAGLVNESRARGVRRARRAADLRAQRLFADDLHLHVHLRH